MLPYNVVFKHHLLPSCVGTLLLALPPQEPHSRAGSWGSAAQGPSLGRVWLRSRSYSTQVGPVQPGPRATPRAVSPNDVLLPEPCSCKSVPNVSTDAPRSAGQSGSRFKGQYERFKQQNMSAVEPQGVEHC